MPPSRFIADMIVGIMLGIGAFLAFKAVLGILRMLAGS
jgi:hypothetical protein